MTVPPDETEADVDGEVTGAAAQMRAAREAAEMSLEDIAQETRVPLRHLKSLEEGDFGALPGTTYCAGFARAYARSVGLDEAALVAQLRHDIDEIGGVRQNTFEFEEAVNPARIPPRWLAWAAALIVLLLAAGYGLWRMQLTTPPTDDQIAVQRAHEAKAQNAARTLKPRTPIVQTGPVVLTAADDVWLRIYQPDGTRIYEGTLTRGQSYTVPPNARNPMILTGRPDALAITVGGQAVPPLGTAERTISDVPVSAAALLARPKPQPSDSGAGRPAAATKAPAAQPPAPVSAPALAQPAPVQPSLPKLDSEPTGATPGPDGSAR